MVGIIKAFKKFGNAIDTLVKRVAHSQRIDKNLRALQFVAVVLIHNPHRTALGPEQLLHRIERRRLIDAVFVKVVAVPDGNVALVGVVG